LSPVLEGSRIRLERTGLKRARALAEGDLSVVRAGDGWPHADSLSPIRSEAAYAVTDEQTGFLAVLRDTGEVIGECGWKGGPDASGTAEIGYGLAIPYRRQGLGRELVQLLVGWSFEQPGCSHLIAEVHQSNIASRRVLERLGFSLDEIHDPYVTYGLSPERARLSE
jgi:ribosomal-protein-alanine N-acetyltransferase